MKIIYIDLFCGAGGVSTGIENAKINGDKCCIVGACCNHDINAIRSHHENHPHIMHFREDIRTLDLTEMKMHINKLKSQHVGAKVVLWASLECTNFSRAKGGESRSQDSRTLATHLYRYIDEINPDAIQIENVDEFKLWGPQEVKLCVSDDGCEYCKTDVFEDQDGKKYLVPVMQPIRERMGEDYDGWCDDIKSRGYEYKFDTLNSADFGGYTSRYRFFGVFYKPDIFDFEFPKPFESKQSALSVLDRSAKGSSIISRKKLLVDKTISGIINGIERHKVYLDQDTNPFLCYMQYGHSYTVRVDTTLPTITTNPKHNILEFIKVGNIKSIITKEKGNNIIYVIVAPGGSPYMNDHVIYDGHKAVITVSKDISYTYHSLIKKMIRLGVIDITNRRLTILELRRLMGFPDDYILHGSNSEQMKYIGNAVDVNISRVIAEQTVRSYKRAV